MTCKLNYVPTVNEIMPQLSAEVGGLKDKEGSRACPL
jgi:hypothetical protein